MLKIEFVHVVLGFQSQNLILCLLRQAVTSLRQVVKLLNTLNNVADLLVQASVHLVLYGLLLASCINLLFELLILTLKLIVGV